MAAPQIADKKFPWYNTKVFMLDLVDRNVCFPLPLFCSHPSVYYLCYNSHDFHHFHKNFKFRNSKAYFFKLVVMNKGKTFGIQDRLKLFTIYFIILKYLYKAFSKNYKPKNSKNTLFKNFHIVFMIEFSRLLCL